MDEEVTFIPPNETMLKLHCLELAVEHTKSKSCTSGSIIEIAQKFYDFVKTTKEN